MGREVQGGEPDPECYRFCSMGIKPSGFSHSPTPWRSNPGSIPVSIPPDDTKMTREGAERLSTGSSSSVSAKPPSVLVAKESS